MGDTCPILIHAVNYSYGEYIRSLVRQFGLRNIVLAGRGLTWNSFARMNPQIAVFETGSEFSPVLIKAIKKRFSSLVIIFEGDLPAIRRNNNLICLGKPIHPDILREAIARQLVQNGTQLPSDALSEPFLLGEAKGMHAIRGVIARVSKTDLSVLILGESGTGKGVAALAIHNNSSRRSGPFQQVNSASIPAELLESELFGYRKGAFTGAWEDKPGKFDIADSGTLFLDEISEMHPSMQAKILHVLQSGEFAAIGDIKGSSVDVRVIAATNANLTKLIESGRFREDLYYRLNVISIVMPPLRERKEDIPLLIEYFFEKYNLLHNKGLIRLSKNLLSMFTGYDWPGNVRELENAIRSIVVLGNENLVADELKKKTVPQSPEEKRDPELFDSIGRLSLKEISNKVARRAEGTAIRDALQVSAGNRKHVAMLLKVSYKSILNKIKEHGL
ncbi:MAG: sigma-54 interaction domain-containing protein [Desulfobacteria bacterium]